MSKDIDMQDKRLHPSIAGIYMNTPVLTAFITAGRRDGQGDNLKAAPWQ